MRCRSVQSGYSRPEDGSVLVFDVCRNRLLGVMYSQCGKAGCVYDEMLLTVNADKATPVDRVDLSDVDLREREHLQEWILANPAVLGPDVEIITSEYGPVADRWRRPGP